MMPSVGDLVDEVFRVEEELDHGNFGAVYKVSDLIEQRILAMKVLKPGPHDEDELRQRFEREARLIYSLRHPHVVQVFYYGQTDSGLPYMAMEYLQGTDLRALLQHHGSLSNALSRRITIETLSALHSAHNMGIIHRDLKPANIYLVNDGGKGHVKVLDFGFAKALESEVNDEITNAGTLVGTPAYMSPELVHKKDVGPAADIYAMGLILAEMLQGKKVVQIESIYDTILYQGSEKDIKLPKPLRNSQFGPILQKSITKNLDERYSSALEMINDLRELDLEGVGPYTDDVFLSTAPPEVGSADHHASTRPRTDGRPSLEEVDAALNELSDQYPADFRDSDPTVEQSQRDQERLVHATNNGASPNGASPNGASPARRDRKDKRRDDRLPTDQFQRASPTASPKREVTDAVEISSEQPAAVLAQQQQYTSRKSGFSALRDIAVGIFVGGLVLAILFMWVNTL